MYRAAVSGSKLQRWRGGGKWLEAEQIAAAIPATALSATVDLSGHHGKRYRIVVRRDGDAETGGVSAPFDLNRRSEAKR